MLLDVTKQYNQLFQVMFTFFNKEMFLLEATDVTLGIEKGMGTGNIDLGVALFERKRGMQGVFGYRSDLFEESTIERMTRNFQTLLEWIVTHPDLRLSELVSKLRSTQNQ
jgi:non-ribosomal peptide synthetase component F